MPGRVCPYHGVAPEDNNLTTSPSSVKTTVIIIANTLACPVSRDDNVAPCVTTHHHAPVKLTPHLVSPLNLMSLVDTCGCKDGAPHAPFTGAALLPSMTRSARTTSPLPPLKVRVAFRKQYFKSFRNSGVLSS